MIRKILNTISEMRSFTDNKVVEINENGEIKYSIGGTRLSRKSNINVIIKDKKLLYSFDKKSIIQLIAHKKEDKSIINNTFEKNHTFLNLLSMIYVAVFISANIFVGRFITFNPIELPFPGGILGFPLTFAILNIITEYYSLKTAKKIIYYGIISMFFFVGLLYLYDSVGTLYPTQKSIFIDKALSEIFFSQYSNALGIVVAGSIATLISDTSNCYLLSFLKIRWHSKKLWLRCIIATSLGEVIFSSIWIIIYTLKTHILPNSDIILSILAQTIFKSTYEIFTIPFTYMLVFWLRYKYGDENASRYI